MRYVKRMGSSIGVLLIAGSLWVATSVSLETMKVSVTPHVYATLQLAVVLQNTEQELRTIAQIIQKDLSFSGQFDVSVQEHTQPLSKQGIVAYAEQHYPLVIFLTKKEPNKIEWRLYDTGLATMIKGKRLVCTSGCPRGWAHAIADALWPLLTGQESSFSSKLAYCKDSSLPGKKRHTQICIADYDGSNEQVLVSTPTVNIAPRWNGDRAHPLLFYSEGANANIRLMCVTMQRQRTISSNFDGINMLPSFSGTGDRVVYCASRGSGTCQLYLYEKGKFKRLTQHAGTSISPSLSADGKVLFYCADDANGKPQIYRLDLITQESKAITNGGYNFCPNYHQPSGKVIYTKLVEGKSQLFMYDEHEAQHTQLTYDATNKDECCWSPCGSYILFSVEERGTSQLAQLNIHTKEQRPISTENCQYTYPTWSPCYFSFPVAG